MIKIACIFLAAFKVAIEDSGIQGPTASITAPQIDFARWKEEGEAWSPK